VHGTGRGFSVMTSNRSVRFFDTQFRRQLDAREFALNPFEQAALPYLSGRVLDLGCGLGNLGLAAARRGCQVVAVDASPAAIDHLARVAGEEELPLVAIEADVLEFEIPGSFDAAIAIGLLMFLPCPDALALLDRVQRAVRPEGCAIVNVLAQGTTYLDMFDLDRYCLFASDQLEKAFAGWTVLLSRADEFSAPGGTVKRFATLIARKPHPPRRP